MPYFEERQLSSFDKNLFYSFFLRNYTEEESNAPSAVGT